MASKLYNELEHGTLSLAFLEKNRDFILGRVRMQRLRNPLVWIAMEAPPAFYLAGRISALRQMMRMILSEIPELIQTKDVIRCTVLHDAARWCDDPKMLEMLMCHKLADVNGKDDVDYAPLHYAAHVNNIAAMKQLLSVGAKVDALANIFDMRYPPLYLALPYPKGVSLLLMAGADATWTGHSGETLLHYLSDDLEWARRISDDDVVDVARMLLVAGVDPLDDAAGVTAATRASTNLNADAAVVAFGDDSAVCCRPMLAKWLQRAEAIARLRGRWWFRRSGLQPLLRRRRWRPPIHWLCHREVRDVVHWTLLAAQRISDASLVAGPKRRSLVSELPPEVWFYILGFLPLH